MTPNGFSRLQITLHWAVAALILWQFLASGPMNMAMRQVNDGQVPDGGFAVGQHILAGLLVLAFALWRLVLRLTRGVPGPAAGESAAQILLAKLVHLALYAAMLALPLTGLAAWFGGIKSAQDAHQLAKMALLLFMALHVVGAFYNQYVLKNGLIGRMMRARD